MKRFNRLSLSVLACISLPFMANAEREPESKWRTLAPENLVVMSMAHGDVIIELAPDYAPRHVAQFKQLIQDGLYNDNKFYRVIDGFVAQTGPDDNVKPEAKKVKTLSLEGDWAIDKTWQMTLVQQNDLFAEQTGFKQGFAMAANPSEGKAWLTHCPGAVAMARGNDADSGTSHFYINNGQAPRYLDRIMSIFGRVVYGMNHVQAIQRTQVDEGDRAIPPAKYTVISSMNLMSDLPVEQQWQLAVENTESTAFVERIDKRRKRPHAFFFKKPPPVLDVCQVPIATRVIKRPE